MSLTSGTVKKHEQMLEKHKQNVKVMENEASGIHVGPWEKAMAELSSLSSHHEVLFSDYKVAVQQFEKVLNERDELEKQVSELKSGFGQMANLAQSLGTLCLNIKDFANKNQERI